jgi:phage terminase small subunit
MPHATEAQLATFNDLGIDVVLSPKESAFVRFLVADPNLDHVKAAEQAGYRNPKVVGCMLLKKPKLFRAVALLIRRSFEKAVTTKEQVLDELAAVAFQNLADFFDENGNQLGMHQIPRDKARVIKEFRCKKKVLYNENGEEIGYILDQKIETWDKSNALALWMKHLQLLLPDVQVNQVILAHDQALIDQARETMTDDAIREAATKDNPQQWLLARWLTGMLSKLPGGRERVREIVEAETPTLTVAQTEAST